MNDRVIHAEYLREFLRVSRQALYDWRESGYLPSNYTEGSADPAYHYYLHSSIDAFLQKCALHPNQLPPPVAKLLAYYWSTRLPALLTIEEVATRWDVDRKTVVRLLTQGKIPGIALTEEAITNRNRLVRIPAPSLGRISALVDHPDVVTGRFAARMLAIKPRLFTEVLRHKLLDQVDVVSSSTQTYVSIISLRRLLATLVYNCTVDQWWEMQLAHDFADIITKNEALRRLQVHHRKLTAAMQDKIPYIKTPLSEAQLRVPFYVARQWQEELGETRISPAQIAVIFGISEELAKFWAVKRAFCRMQGKHIQHRKICPLPTCINAYIDSHQVGPTFTSAEWLVWVHEDHMAPSPLRANATLSEEDISAAVGAGKLQGVLLPNGIVTYASHTISAVFAERRKQRLEERRIMGA